MGRSVERTRHIILRVCKNIRHRGDGGGCRARLFLHALFLCVTSLKLGGTWWPYFRRARLLPPSPKGELDFVRNHSFVPVFSVVPVEPLYYVPDLSTLSGRY
jgi:hypothetical protein